MQSESVHMQSESVHIHMTGVTDTRAHYFSVDGYTAMTSVVFNTWATEKMDSALGKGIIFIGIFFSLGSQPRP